MLSLHDKEKKVGETELDADALITGQIHTLQDLIQQLADIEMSYDKLQAHLRKFSDARLYHSILQVDVGAIREAACYEPAKFDLPKLALEDAQRKLDALLKSEVIIPSSVSHPGTYERLYFFCLLEVYDRIRAQEPEYKSRGAYLGAFLMSGASRTEKQGFCKLYKQFICSHFNLNQFDNYLRDLGLHNMKSTILEKRSRLAFIHNLVEKKGNEFEAKKQASATPLLLPSNK
jgi:hypothetical protein